MTMPSPTHPSREAKTFWHVAGSVVQGGGKGRWLEDAEIEPLLSDLQRDMDAAKAAGLPDAQSIARAMAQLLIARANADEYRKCMEPDHG